MFCHERITQRVQICLLTKADEKIRGYAMFAVFDETFTAVVKGHLSIQHLTHTQNDMTMR